VAGAEPRAPGHRWLLRARRTARRAVPRLLLLVPLLLWVVGPADPWLGTAAAEPALQYRTPTPTPYGSWYPTPTPMTNGNQSIPGYTQPYAGNNSQPYQSGNQQYQNSSQPYQSGSQPYQSGSSSVQNGTGSYSSGGASVQNGTGSYSSGGASVQSGTGSYPTGSYPNDGSSIQPGSGPYPGGAPSAGGLPGSGLAPNAAPPSPSTGSDPCYGDEQITFAPDEPRVGDELLIAVTSARPHPYGRLAGTEPTHFVRERPGQRGYVWEWTIQPSYPGQHEYTFYVDSTIPCQKIQLTVQGQLATPTPKPTKTPKPFR
jgi:hypothetical protein